MTGRAGGEQRFGAARAAHQAVARQAALPPPVQAADEGGLVTPNAVIWRIVADNPKTVGTANHQVFAPYPSVGVPVTVAEHVAKAAAHGFPASLMRGDFAHDLRRGYIEIALPEGGTILSGHILPTEELLRRLTREIED